MVIFWGVIFLGYNWENKLVVHPLEYRPLPPSFDVGLGLLTVGTRSKLNPLNIEVRRKEEARLTVPFFSLVVFFPDTLF